MTENEIDVLLRNAGEGAESSFVVSLASDLDQIRDTNLAEDCITVAYGRPQCEVEIPLCWSEQSLVPGIGKRGCGADVENQHQDEEEADAVCQCRAHAHLASKLTIANASKASAITLRKFSLPRMEVSRLGFSSLSLIFDKLLHRRIHAIGAAG